MFYKNAVIWTAKLFSLKHKTFYNSSAQKYLINILVYQIKYKYQISRIVILISFFSPVFEQFPNSS